MLIKTVKSDVIMKYLNQRFLVNENIIGVIENVPEAEIYVDNIDSPKGVLVKKDEYMHYVYTEDDAFIDDMCSSYIKEGFMGFSGVEGELAEKIRNRFLVNWESRCTLYYQPKENLDLSLKKNPTQPIKLEDAEVVDHFYQFRGPETLEIIRRDITNRPSSAVYVDGEIACWVLIHDDNSMGIMYTKEEHRRKGYAVDVTVDLSNKILQAGKIPFLQIIQGNGMSPGLAKKCGFVTAGKAEWFGIIVGVPGEIIEINDRSRARFLESLPEALRGSIYDGSTTYKGLFNALHSFKYNPYNNEGMNFIKAENEKEKKDWCDITSQGLKGIDTMAAGEALQMLAENPSFNLYVLYKGDTPIAASTTHKYEEWNDRALHFLSTEPEHRNSDIFKIMINETAQAEKQNGCEFMVAQAEERLVELFRELHFRESHTIKL
jgi:hypothetical protein